LHTRTRALASHVFHAKIVKIVAGGMAAENWIPDHADELRIERMVWEMNRLCPEFLMAERNVLQALENGVAGIHLGAEVHECPHLAEIVGLIRERELELGNCPACAHPPQKLH